MRQGHKAVSLRKWEIVWLPKAIGETSSVVEHQIFDSLTAGLCSNPS